MRRDLPRPKFVLHPQAIQAHSHTHQWKAGTSRVLGIIAGGNAVLRTAPFSWDHTRPHAVSRLMWDSVMGRVVADARMFYSKQCL